MGRGVLLVQCRALLCRHMQQALVRVAQAAADAWHQAAALSQTLLGEAGHHLQRLALCCKVQGCAAEEARKDWAALCPRQLAHKGLRLEPGPHRGLRGHLTPACSARHRRHLVGPRLLQPGWQVGCCPC